MPVSIVNIVAVLIAAAAVVVRIWVVTTADHLVSAGQRPIAAAG